MKVYFSGIRFWGGCFLTVVEKNTPLALHFERFEGEPILNSSNREINETAEEGLRISIPWGKEDELISQYFVEIRPINIHFQYSHINVNITIEKNGEDLSSMAPQKIKDIRNDILKRAITFLEERFFLLSDKTVN